MNYSLHYHRLIERAKNQSLKKGERHHITPKCMGGDDNADNIVVLSPREHYVAHQLLVRIYPKNYLLIFAAKMMCVGNHRASNRLYSWLKQRHSKVVSELQSGKGNSQFGKKWITNGTVSKIIPQNEIIPDSWYAGRRIVKKTRRQQKSEDRKSVNVKRVALNQVRASEWYEIYRLVGFDEFVSRTGYANSKPALIQFLARYASAFVAQNGKKRFPGAQAV